MVISAWEHNAVTRTLASIPEVTVQVAQAPLFDDQETVAAFERALECRPAAVICTCVSNVFGYALPIRQIAAACRRAGIPLVLDASQAAGCMSISMKELGADYIAFPGHKRAVWSPGYRRAAVRRGRRYLVSGVDRRYRQRIYETGDASVLAGPGEAGTHNVAGVAGLLEGVRFVRRTGVDRIARHERMLLKQLEQGLHLDGVQFLPLRQEIRRGCCPSGATEWIASPGPAAGATGQGSGGGLHCAPLAHRSCRYTGHRYGPGELFRL